MDSVSHFVSIIINKQFYFVKCISDNLKAADGGT